MTLWLLLQAISLVAPIMMGVMAGSGGGVATALAGFGVGLAVGSASVWVFELGLRRLQSLLDRSRSEAVGDCIVAGFYAVRLAVASCAPVLWIMKAVVQPM